MIAAPTRLVCSRAKNWLAAACALLPATASFAQAPPDWQPFREASQPAATEFDPQSQVAPAQAICEPTCDPMGMAVGAPVVMCPQPMFAAPAAEMPYYMDASSSTPTSPEFWQWRVLPLGVIWQSYWASVHEPRMSGVAFADGSGGSLLDATLGGRFSVLRYGTEGSGRPMGAELQIEGAATPRINFGEEWDLDAADFRAGVPIVYGRERWQTKLAYYHISAHMGDEFAIREMALADRINYVRDSIVLAASFFPMPAWRWYAEAGWAFNADGGADPWELQFGVDVADPAPTGLSGTPFFAVNGHLRQEHNYGGNVVFQAGWLWRGSGTGTLRTGFHYFNGKTNQYQFFDNFEQQIGGGLWYDF